MLARAALGGIWVYQTWLSPRKGFRCAYSVRHGGTGCSGFAKAAIREHGALRAIPLLRQRLRDCKSAYLALRSETEDETQKPGKAKRCARELRDSCGDAALYQACDCGQSCAGRAALRSIRKCDADCDFCSCG